MRVTAMIKCSYTGCNYVGPQGVVIFAGGTITEYCKLHNPKAFRGSPDKAKSIFEGGFTLEHVRDKQTGRPITVNSVKELRQVEKEHNVALAVMTDDGDAAASPPQHEPWAGNIAHKYKKKWNRDPNAYKKENVTGVSAGVVKNKRETLVDHPRPLK